MKHLLLLFQDHKSRLIVSAMLFLGKGIFNKLTVSHALAVLITLYVVIEIERTVLSKLTRRVATKLNKTIQTYHKTTTGINVGKWQHIDPKPTRTSSTAVVKVNESSPTFLERSPTGEKLILIYPNTNYLKKRFKHCEFTHCRIVSDPAMYDQCDALLVHLTPVQNITRDLPSYKPPHMTWIAKFKEAPVRPFPFGDPSAADGLFDIVLTYSKRSDIPDPYGRMDLISKSATSLPDQRNINYAKGRTRGVAWLISHCFTRSKRELYVLQLQKYIDISIYGACGIQTCKRGPINCNPMKPIGKIHKFYLSFENSLCDEYVTEKLWNAMEQRLLPIVLGITNYSQILPKYSFINIRDFPSPKLLAEYLIKLDRNDTLYNEYFWWTRTYFVNRTLHWECDICKYLHVNKKNNRTYQISKFWDHSTCISPRDFYRKIAPEIDVETREFPYIKPIPPI